MRSLGAHALALFLVLSCGPALAENLEFTESNAAAYNEAMVNDIVNRVQEVVREAQVDHAPPRTCCQDECCPTCCPGMSAGVDLLILRPVSGSLGVLGLSSAEFDYDVGTRFWLGYRWENCLGFRTRYFQYDHTSRQASFSFATTTILYRQAVDQDVLDFEATYGWHRHCWSFLVSGGLRYLNNESTTSLNVFDMGMDEGGGIISVRKEGIGPTLALEATAPIPCCRGLAFYSIGRVSIVGGDAGLSANVTDPGFADFLSGFGENQFLMGIGELQTGLQYSRRYGSSLLFFRAGAEGQIWTESDYSIGFPDEVEDEFGMVGINLTVGIQR